MVISTLCEATRALFRALIVAAIVGAAAATERPTQPVALVVDLQGGAKLSGPNGAQTLSILSEILEGTELELAPAARMVLVWLGTGEELSFTGPASMRFAPTGPERFSGMPPVRRTGIAKDRFPRQGLVQAGAVMRSGKTSTRIRLLTPAGTTTLDPAPEFRWQPLPGVRQYRFELSDSGGRLLLSRDVAGDAVGLPESLQLEEDVGYVWGVSVRLSDGRSYATYTDFKLISTRARERVEALRPSVEASVAERVAFALWLTHEQLLDEARKYWRDAAAERPEDPTLKRLAEQ